MSRVLIDSNVLLDVATNDARFAEWSAEQLDRCVEAGIAVINQIVLAEVSAGYRTPSQVKALVPADDYQHESLPWEAAWVAARAFRLYRQRGGTRVTPLPDFYIGAHAQVGRLTLLTRDVRRFQTYFPEVELISPPDELIIR